ncbi:3793_t:CDS:1, partial [Paraglomus brasilianum]
NGVAKDEKRAMQLVQEAARQGLRSLWQRTQQKLALRLDYTTC